MSIAREASQEEASHLLGKLTGVLSEEEVAAEKRRKAKLEGAKIELFIYRPAVVCHGPWITLEMSGQPYVLRDVDIEEDEHLSDEFKALNPNCKLPVLRDIDATGVWESNAIKNPANLGLGHAKGNAADCESRTREQGRP